MFDISTSRLTQILQDAVTAHQPPMVGGRRIKMRFAHLGGHNPPVIVIHGNQTSQVPNSYRRYLENEFRKVFKLEGTPIKVEFKQNANPYAGRVSSLTDAQKERKRRQVQKFKKRDKKR